MISPSNSSMPGSVGVPRGNCRSRYRTAIVILALAAIILAIEPAGWLVMTWRDPAYQSDGLLVTVLIAALFLWSLASPLRGDVPPAKRALPLLAASALVRMAGQLSAINVIGAMTLVVDVYALALLARLDVRRNALSPAWLAVAFAFSLPLERMVQRSIGFGLQQLSADGACALLGAAFDNVRCQGIRILLDGRDVLVDLPCSGARTLLLTALAYTLACAVTQPRARHAATGAVVMLVAAIVANMVRISVLAIGIAHPDAFGGIDVMDGIWHDAIGYGALAIGLLPLLGFMRVLRGRDDEAVAPGERAVPRGGRIPIARQLIWLGGITPAVLTLLATLIIVNLPRRAFDVASADTTLTVPAFIGASQAVPVSISGREAHYFTAYGGAAAKASYGASSLMLVRTTSPLRHLHAPDECLRGLGFSVTYRGMSFAPLPTAHYIATSPEGRSYRVDVSFASSHGHVTGSVAVAVWHWLKREARQWTAIQRISPVELPVAEHQAFSAAALFALGIEPPPPTVPATLAPTPRRAPLFVPDPSTTLVKG